MTDTGINNVIDRINNLLIEVPPMTVQETGAWFKGAEYMKTEIITILESMKDGRS